MWIFDTSGFLSRAHCGIGWTREFIFTDRLSNLSIFIAYFIIAHILFYFWTQRRRYVPFHYVFMMFGLFILFCGLTHLCNFLVFDWPAYHLFVVIDSITAILSITTASILPLVIKHFLTFPSLTRLTNLVDSLQAEILKSKLLEIDYNNRIKLLTHKVTQLERDLKSREWIERSNSTINELKDMLKKDIPTNESSF